MSKVKKIRANAKGENNPTSKDLRIFYTFPR